MGIIKYAKGLWVGGKRIVTGNHDRAQKTDWDSGRCEGPRVQQLRLRLYSGEATEVVVVLLNDGMRDIVVDGFVLPPGHYLENIASPLPHPTALYPQPQNQSVLTTINEGSTVPESPPPYAGDCQVHTSA